jgi:hypothetical protein
MISDERMRSSIDGIKHADPALMRAMSEKEQKEGEESFERFKADFKRGLCMLCGKPLKSFAVGNPCIHWLLRPNGFKKKHFPLLFELNNYRVFSSYVRWVATIEAPLRNINDLVDEHGGQKLIDFTARYKHITWSFSCSESDFIGHQSSSVTNFPHYHFQMRMNGRPFINYNDFHIPFAEEDYFILETMRRDPDLIKIGYAGAEGMQAVMENEAALEAVVDGACPIESARNSTFRVSSLVCAPDGETLSGEMLASAIKEAQEEGKTVASVMRKNFKTAKVLSIVYPSDGVVSSLPRSELNRGKRKAPE